MPAALLPVPPGTDPALTAVLTALVTAVAELQQPTQPQADFVIDTAANLLAQAPAENHRGARAIVTSVPCLAISVETSTNVWEWKRADGSNL